MQAPANTTQQLREEISALQQKIRNLEKSAEDREQTVKLLREGEERRRLLIENSHDIIYKLTAEGVFTFVSPAWTVLLGHPTAAVTGQPFQRFVHPDDLPGCLAFLRAVLETGRRQEGVQYRVRHLDGAWRWHTSSSVPLSDEAGRIAGFVGIARDITEHKKAVSALQESETNFRTFFDTVDDMIIVGSPDGKIMYANPAMTRKLGYTPDELREMHVLDLHGADKRREAEAIFSAMFKGERVVCPLPLVSKTGDLIPVETRVWFGKWSGENCIFGVSKDLTREQEALQKFDRFFNANPAAMAVSSLPDGGFTDINDAFLKTLGYARGDVLGRTSTELGLFVEPAKQQDIAGQLRREGRIDNLELQVRCRDGMIRDGLFSGEIIESQGKRYFLTVMIDQTDRRQAEKEKEALEAQNRQLQKTESLHRMAGAVAHHFNNLLGVVIGNLELAMYHPRDEGGTSGSLNAAMEAAKKATELSGLMLTYLGHSFEKRERLDLAEACRRVLPRLRATIPKKATLETDLPHPGPAVLANQELIEQLLTSLFTNGWEALGNAAGTLRLRVGTTAASDISAIHRFPAGWQPQGTDYAFLEVADTGCGIAEADMTNLFEPFFSRKFTGRGLGLPVALGIARAHGGAVAVQSEPDRGSVFTVFLPPCAP